MRLNDWHSVPIFLTFREFPDYSWNILITCKIWRINKLRPISFSGKRLRKQPSSLPPSPLN